MQRRFPARWCEFDAIRLAIGEFAAQTGICTEDCHRLLVIAEELFVNSVRHGYGGECDRPVWITLACADSALELRFEDEAPQFDPTARAPLAGLDGDPDSRPVGGLGVFLALAMSREARYRREEGRNVVEFSFARSDQVS